MPPDSVAVGLSRLVSPSTRSSAPHLRSTVPLFVSGPPIFPSPLSSTVIVPDCAFGPVRRFAGAGRGLRERNRPGVRQTGCRSQLGGRGRARVRLEVERPSVCDGARGVDDGAAAAAAVVVDRQRLIGRDRARQRRIAAGWYEEARLPGAGQRQLPFATWT